MKMMKMKMKMKRMKMTDLITRKGEELPTRTSPTYRPIPRVGHLEAPHWLQILRDKIEFSTVTEIQK